MERLRSGLGYGYAFERFRTDQRVAAKLRMEAKLALAITARATFIAQRPCWRSTPG
jgi:hypothetical protein